MQESMVRLVFAGEILPGYEVATVKRNLAALLKISDEQAERLFAGSEVTIKKALPASRVDTYLGLLRDAGAVIRIEAEAVVPVAAMAVGGDSQWPTVDAALAAPPPPWRQAAPEPAPEPAAQAESEPEAPSMPEEPPVEEVDCPKCGLHQPKRTLCRGCGTDMPRFLRAQLEVKRDKENPPEVLRRVGAVAETIESGTPPILGWSFAGRIGRVRYWMHSFAGMALVCVPLAFIAWQQALFGSATSFLLAFGVASLALLYLTLRATAHRLHDIGFSGWLVLLRLIPVLGELFSLALLFWPGSERENEYGLPPDVNTPAVVVGAVLAPVMAIFLSLVSSSALLPLIQKYVLAEQQQQQPLSEEQAIEALMARGMSREQAEKLIEDSTARRVEEPAAESQAEEE